MKKFKAMYAFMLAFFSKESLIEDGKINLTEDMQQKLQDALGEKVKLSDVVEQMNLELAEAASGGEDDQELRDLKAEAMKQLIAQGLSQEDAEQAIDDPKTTAGDPDIKQLLTGLIEHNKKTDKMLEQLLKEPEGDTPDASGKFTPKSNMHSKTHFLASGNAYDAFANRPWNQKAAGLLVNSSPTDFKAEDKVAIQTLKGDIDLYYRQNPTEIESLERDLLGLPSFWPIQTRVDDRVADGFIVSDEISQARKKGWLPKNRQSIQAEENKVFPVHIDIEHEGFDLQQIETSWLNAWNKEGSQPFKMSFVRFLLGELIKKARQEDRKVAINGVYVKTPDTATSAGNAINRGDGLIVQLFRAYFYDKKFKIANIGTPTTSNIVDYVVSLIEKNISEDDKNADGKVVYLSPSWLRAYKVRYRQLYGLDNDYSKDRVMEIENYPNFRFEKLRDLEGSDFMFVTDDNNIKLMENVPNEKSMFNFDSLKRQLFIYADYKWGSGFRHIGTKVKDTDPVAFKVQTVWCNIPPYIPGMFVQLFDDATGEVNLPYSNIEVRKDWATDITDIKNTYAGQVVKVRGNTSATGKVVDTGNITLTGDVDFNLNTGGTLTLLVNDDTTLTEIKRTSAPDVTPPSDVNFDNQTIDANEGNVFKYTGTTDTLDAIINGVDGQIITIYGTAGAATLTVSDVSGNINVGANRVLAVALDYTKLIKVDGVWEEIEFNIEA